MKENIQFHRALSQNYPLGEIAFSISTCIYSVIAQYSVLLLTYALQKLVKLNVCKPKLSRQISENQRNCFIHISLYIVQSRYGDTLVATRFY